MYVYIVIAYETQHDFIDRHGDCAEADKYICGVYDSFEKASAARLSAEIDDDDCVAECGTDPVEFWIERHSLNNESDDPIECWMPNRDRRNVELEF